MRILVVGGRGMIGTHAARHLTQLGHEVTLGARSLPAEETEWPVIVGDYVARTFTAEQLAPFDAVVFAAGQDVRHVRSAAADEAFWRAAQSEGVPAFAALARDAGVKRFIQIGSYYHVVMPELVATNPYIAARSVADRNARALASPDFAICTLNPPSVVGVIPGPSLERYRTLVAWARGERPDIPDFAPSGGTNYVSADALAEAIGNALDHAQSGHAYLIGDRNLSYRQFFQLIFDAAGGRTTLAARDESHPMLPDNFIVHGRGVTLSYETPAESRALMPRHEDDIARAISAIVAAVDA